MSAERPLLRPTPESLDIRDVTVQPAWRDLSVDDHGWALVEMYAQFIEASGLVEEFRVHAAAFDPAAALERREVPGEATTEHVEERLVVECPARCIAKGCTDDHGDSGWRSSLMLASGTSMEEARAEAAEYAARYPLSGPYRLVALRTVTTTTTRILPVDVDTPL